MSSLHGVSTNMKSIQRLVLTVHPQAQFYAENQAYINVRACAPETCGL